MAEDLTPMSELDAVNEILSMIGEMPVNSLDDTSLSTASIALTSLRTVSRGVQSEGLNCNTVYNYKLNRNSNGEIQIPFNALNVEPMDRKLDCMVYKNKLYNKDGFTSKFDEDIKVYLTFILEFENLPEHVRQYITVKAKRDFQKKMVGSELLHSLTEQDELEARIRMRSFEVENQDNNMLSGYLASQGSHRRGSVW